MDLLNYQYLDKMNNNIGILCYEGKNTDLYFLWLFLKLLRQRSRYTSDIVDTKFHSR